MVIAFCKLGYDFEGEEHNTKRRNNFFNKEFDEVKKFLVQICNVLFVKWWLCPVKWSYLVVFPRSRSVQKSRTSLFQYTASIANSKKRSFTFEFLQRLVKKQFLPPKKLKKKINSIFIFYFLPRLVKKQHTDTVEIFCHIQYWILDM